MTNIKIMVRSYPGETNAWMVPLYPPDGFSIKEEGYPLTEIGPSGSTSYWVTVPREDIFPGYWSVALGSAAGYLGSRVVVIDDATDDYPIGAPDHTEDNGLYLITATVKDEDGKLIQGARVGIAGTSYSRVSKVGGVAIIPANSGTYSLVTIPPTGFEVPDPVSVTVDGDDAETDIVLTATTLPASTDPTKCKVSLRVISITGSVIVGARVTTRRANCKTIAQSSLVLDGVHDPTTTNANGIAVLELARGVTIVITVRFGDEEQEITYTVPDAASGDATVTV
ncbi:hypothetical protein [Novipirellula rosea]